MLLITDKGKDFAKFWFTLFHEINHILHKKTSFIYLTSKDKTSTVLSLGRANASEENMADDFEKNKLIPSGAYKRFVAKKNFSFSAIKDFAEEIGISECIVIGRLKHDKFLKWNNFTKNQPHYQFICNKFNND